MTLPPGTTQADVDERMAPPEECVVVGDVTVGFAIEASYSPDEADLEEALLEALGEGDWEEVLNVQVVEVDR